MAVRAPSDPRVTSALLREPQKTALAMWLDELRTAELDILSRTPLPSDFRFVQGRISLLTELAQFLDQQAQKRSGVTNGSTVSTGA